MRPQATLLLLAALLGYAAAECPNACSGKGTCGAYDMCTCYPGYMANDCSERICPFGRAHIDTPKGDLDGDGTVESAPNGENSQLYPKKTSEFWGDLTTHTAGEGHFYMECSNKGLCDRTTGECQCFEAYEGVNCERASCPNSCSGHGVCKTTREVSKDDNDNIYGLWDADASMVCDCDAGYYGADCSSMKCPYGVDPHYNDVANIQSEPRYPVWTFELEDTANTAFTGTAYTAGSYRIKWYDVYGEDWITEPLRADTGLTASLLEDALEALPNNVIPTGSTTCALDNSTNDILKYTCTFGDNSGEHKVPEIIKVDDEGRPTTRLVGVATFGGTELTTRVYDTGVVGEFIDYFATNCHVKATVPTANALTGAATDDVFFMSMHKVTVAGATDDTSLTVAQALSKLKACLGDSDGNSANDVDAESWDYGDIKGARGSAVPATAPSISGEYPHLVKLVINGSGSDKAGTFGIMYFDSSAYVSYAAGAGFHLTTKHPVNTYDIFATDGVLQNIWKSPSAALNHATHTLEEDDVRVLASWTQYSNTVTIDGDYSCGSKPAVTSAANGYKGCIEKGDLLVFAVTYWAGDAQASADNNSPAAQGSRLDDGAGGGSSANICVGCKDADGKTPNSAGLYKVMKIEPNAAGTAATITVDRPLTANGAVSSGAAAPTIPVYKFIPNSLGSGAYEYSAECANRGICDSTSGLCQCFPGYYKDNCDTQSAIAV